MTRYQLRNPSTGQFVGAYWTLPRMGLWSDARAKANGGMEDPRKTVDNITAAKRLKTIIEKKFGVTLEIVEVA